MNISIKQSLKWILGIFLPPSCPICRVNLPYDAAGVSICADCWPDLPFVKEGETVLPNPSLMTDVDTFVAPFIYDDPIKGLIHKLKYQDSPELAKALASYMAEPVRKYILSRNAEEDILVLAVPMHKKRLLKRQFNQSDLLAKNLARSMSLAYVSECLKRVKSTEQQQGKTRKQRQKNLKNAFEVSENLVKNKDIILVDDVWTTGSTAIECAKVLKDSGANSVNVVALCYVER